jgi:hypothetical protein
MMRVWGAAGLAVVLAMLSACTQHPAAHLDRAPPSTETAVVRSTYSVGLSFEHPNAWLPLNTPGMSTFSTSVAYLGTGPGGDACKPVSGNPGEVTCGWPNDVVAPSAVFVAWDAVTTNYGRHSWEANTTIAGRPARVMTARPGDCGRVHADETITAQLEWSARGWFDMSACLRGPGIDVFARQVNAMLKSVTITPRKP